LLEALRISRGDGSLTRELAALAKTDLLILDDSGLKPLGAAEKHYLLEAIEHSHGI
jgi:DNA replication protein DnaC